jgi:glycosyltransferase involved in cell wall biosynthesis
MKAVMSNSHRPKLVFFATAWGPKHGGPNSFNTDLVQTLARSMRSYEVICVVLNASPPECEAAAREHKVKLISLDREHEEEFDLDWAPHIAEIIESQGDYGPVEWWVGHDLITGPIAQRLAKRSGSGSLALVMHSSYDYYSDVKHPAAKAAGDKHRMQKRLFLTADVCFSIGPLLDEQLSWMVKEKMKPQMLVPGLSVVEQSHSEHRLCALVFGRLDWENDRIKQGRLAVAAFANAVARVKDDIGLGSKLFRDPILKVLGIEDNEEIKQEILRMAQLRANRAVSIQMMPYTEDRQLLREVMDGVNLCLFLSWHEGFGLAAWEAIAAGIPLVLSKKTGVYQLLDDEIGGYTTGCVKEVDIRGSYGFDNQENFHEEDINAVCKAILDVASDLPKRLKGADFLRRVLKQQGHTWEKMAQHFAKALKLKLDLEEEAIIPKLNEEVKKSFGHLITTFNSANFRATLEVVKTLLSIGRYYSAQQELHDIEGDQASESDVAEFRLLKGQTLLRLNEYDEAAQMAQAAKEYFVHVGSVNKVIQAESILNTMWRDRGEYSKAIESARTMVNTAKEKGIPNDIGSAKRKLARSFALDGQWTEAEREAKEALVIAQKYGNRRDQATSYLALGEAYRHGFFQEVAVQNYRASLDIAADLGDWDCYLWTALGLSDSFLLLQKLIESQSVLAQVGDLLNQKGRRFPIEALHHRLSFAVLSFANGARSDLLFDAILADYKKMTVRWVEQYVEEILRSGRIVIPKRM